MNNLEIAKVLAGKIESSTQEEMELMISITSETHGIDQGWLFRVVGNLYMTSTDYKRADEIANLNQEADPR